MNVKTIFKTIKVSMLNWLWGKNESDLTGLFHLRVGIFHRQVVF